MKITDPGKPATAKDYIAELWETCRTSLEAFVRAGRLLLEAKAKIPHGEFLQVIEGSPYSPDAAQKLMAIARHPVISNTAHAGFLPPAYSTLYELTRLPEAALEEALAAGKITPDLERHQVKKLWGAVAVPDRPAPEYALFRCASCGAHKLLRDDTRPSTLGEDEEAKPRLYDCAECGKTTLTWERTAGPFSKKSLPKSSRAPVEGSSSKPDGGVGTQTEGR